MNNWAVKILITGAGLMMFAFARALTQGASTASSSPPSTENINATFEKMVASQPKWKGTIKVGDEYLPYDAVLNADQTGTFTIHLKDGTDSVVSYTMTMNGRTVTYNYTAANGSQWAWSTTIDDLMKQLQK